MTGFNKGLEDGESSAIQDPVLIYPYTLIGKEALNWSIILFGPVFLLHPFPLPLPPPCRPLYEQGLLQIHSLERSREEIRIKDRALREIQRFITDKPDQTFLKVLKEINPSEDHETLREIVSLLKGKFLPDPPLDPTNRFGQILLCLVHQWMIEQWEIKESLDQIKDQEALLAQSWSENPEEEPFLTFEDIRDEGRDETEVICPKALEAWRDLKSLWSAEPRYLLTDQRWVWADYYGLDPEESQIISIPLPSLDETNSNFSQARDGQQIIHKTGINLREDFQNLWQAFGRADQEKQAQTFQKDLSALGLPPLGKYHLILPPVPSALPGPVSVRHPKGPTPLILLGAG
jgi:hypothetical protein